VSSEAPAALHYDRRRLLIASCVALVATAMTFSIRGDTLKAFGLDFQLTHEQEGYISLLGMWGFPIAILLVGPLCDTIGMGLLLRLAAVGHVAGVILTILSPSLGFPALLLANLVFGLSNGTVEAVINPLVATMYRDEKSAKLNLLHAFWPGGLIIGGLFAFAVNVAMSLPATPVAGPMTSLSWKIKWAAIAICAVVYLFLTIGQEFPHTERVEQGVSNKDMVQSAMVPGFLLLMFCMCLTAITELGPDQWVGSVLTDTVKIQGILFLVYTSGLMFVLRIFAGKFIHALSPVGMLTAAAAISALGLFALSYSFTAGTAFLAATVFGLGKAFFWPTMLGVANERYPRTGALGLAMMGAAGMIAAGLAGPGMGRIYDKGTMAAITDPDARAAVVVGDKVDAKKAGDVAAAAKAGDPKAARIADHLANANKQGAALSFRYVAVLPLAVFLIFGLMLLGMSKQGGYQAVGIEETETPGGEL